MRTLIRLEKLIPAGGAVRRPEQGSAADLARSKGEMVSWRGRFSVTDTDQQEGESWVWWGLRLACWVEEDPQTRQATGRRP